MKDDLNPFDAYNRLNDIMRELDERGLVLTLAAFAEEALGELLRQFMLPGDAADALISGFNAPLGTLSARIKAAFALGLITERQQENLDRLRRIRNEFAHSWEPISFDHQAVASHIAALHYTPLVSEFPTTKTHKLRQCMAATLLEIRSTTGQIEKNGRNTQLIGSHLIPGITENENDKIQQCDRRLEEIQAELRIAEGERLKHLESQRERWLTLLLIYEIGAPADEKRLISDLLIKHTITEKHGKS